MREGNLPEKIKHLALHPGVLKGKLDPPEVFEFNDPNELMEYCKKRNVVKQVLKPFKSETKEDSNMYLAAFILEEEIAGGITVPVNKLFFAKATPEFLRQQKRKLKLNPDKEGRMAKEMFVIELPDKNETYLGKESVGFKQEGDILVPVLKDKEFNTRKEFLSSLKGMMSVAGREAQKAEDMITIMNFFILVKELDENEPYLEVDSDDCKNLKEGFEKNKICKNQEGTRV